MVMIEVNQLANDLPRYQTTLGEKMHALRDKVGSAGVLKNASKMLKDLDKELKSAEGREAAPDKPTLSDRAARTPIPVEVHQPDPGASEALVAMLRPLVVPFTTTGIVLIFLIFFLFQREDLRDRFIRLAGSEDLERTTAALDDAGHRLGRLFITQLTLNAVFGAVIGDRTGRYRRAECAALGLACNVPTLHPLHWRSLSRGPSNRAGCGRGQRLDDDILDHRFVCRGRTSYRPCRRAGGLREKCWSVAGCDRLGGIVLDLALGPVRIASVDATNPLSCGTGQACRSIAVHRRHVGRSTCINAPAGRLPADAHRRSNRGD